MIKLSIILSTITILVVSSQIFKAIQDKLQFHFHKSIFKDKSNWWNPEKSWKNKYEWANGKQWKEWLLSNPLVFITDAWHFFGFLRFLVLIIAIGVSFLTPSLEIWVICTYLTLLYVKARATFHLFFHKLLR